MDEIKRLKEENALLREEAHILREACNSGIWTMYFDESGNETECIWSERFRHLLGYESEEEFPTVRTSLTNAIHPDDQERAELAMRSVIMDYSGKSTYNAEFRVLTKYNGYQWFNSIGRLVRHEDGSPQTMYGLFININERKAQEISLRQQMRVIDALSKDYVSVWLLQPTQKVKLYRTSNTVGAQKAIVQTQDLGGTYSESAVLYANTYVREEEREKFLQALRYDKVVERVKREGTYIYKYLRIYKGREDHFIITFTRTHDFERSGDIVVAFQNVEQLYQEQYEHARTLETSQQELQKALNEKEEHLSQVTKLNEALNEEKRIIRQGLGVIEAMSRDYHTIWLVNKETMQMKLIRTSKKNTIMNAVNLGVKYPDYCTACEKYINTYIVEEEREQKQREMCWEEVLRQLSLSDNYAVNYLRRNERGEVAYHQIMYSNADTEDGQKMFVFGFRDIDKILKEERSKKQELADAKRAAEAANNSKTIFLNNMSHDIRTPMNAIMGFAELMELHKDNSEALSDYLAKIKSSGQYLLTIINNVLDMARIESGQAVVTKEFFDMSSNGNVAYPMFEEQAAKKRLTIVHHEDIKHRYVMLDSTKMLEIATNLLSNAVKYTPEGGIIHLSMTELPCQRKGYGTYVLKVQDNGIGMSKEFAEHVFENFTREHNTTESKVIGTGLGMSIVKKLVELQGGTIHLETEQGKGTTITVTTDHEIVYDPTPYLSQKTGKNNELSLRGKHILLAEDNELNAEIAIAILENIGLKIDHVENGLECVKVLSEAAPHYYDAILMDIQMPIMNGYEATRRIRKLDDAEKAAIPIVALTANAFEEDRHKAIEAGMNTHLAKPIHTDILINVLASFVV